MPSDPSSPKAETRLAQPADRPARRRAAPEAERQSLVSYLVQGSALIGALLFLFYIAGFRG